MESLDIAPPLPDASLLSLTSMSDRQVPTSLSNRDNVSEPRSQKSDHIYAQLVPNGHCNFVGNSSQETSSKKTKVIPDKIFLPNPLPIATGMPLSPWNSAPDIRRPDPCRRAICPKIPSTYGSLAGPRSKNDRKGDPVLEDDPAVFSISGRRVVVSNGFKGGSDKKGDKLLPHRSPPSTIHTRSNSEQSSRAPQEDAGQNERRRRRLQLCTDCFSLCLFVPGTVLCILSPWLLVPLYIIPNFLGSHFHTLIWVCCIGSAILVFIGCLIGNLVWYRTPGKWKCLLHCGKGPRGHYWGDSFSMSGSTHTV